MQIRKLTEKNRKRIGSLNRKKGRKMHGQFLVEGQRAVAAALQAGAPLVEILATEHVLQSESLRERLAAAGRPVFSMSEREGQRLATVENDQGILAVAEMRETPLEALMDERFVLALDGIQDPGNAGTMIRTAAWFGIGGVLVGSGAVDVFNPKAVRSAMGGLWDLRVTQGATLPEALPRFKARGFRLYGADLKGEPLRGVQPEAPALLVIGSEAHGMTDEVAALIDRHVVIPGQPGRRGAESLNASVAAGIVMHWLVGGEAA